ncbi:Hypothetical protein A7982_06445 [Minicystis rosea]|nr:Hypothetical protein A7982_06445 [Minicystis rosea]
MAKAKKDAHPNKDFSAITQTGLKALQLADDNKAALAARLSQSVLDALAADLKDLGVVVPAALVRREVAKTATLTQEEALAQGYALVSAIRTAVVRKGASPEVRKAYGVGTNTNPKIVKRVKAAISQIVDRAVALPAEAASLGILQKDIDALKADLQVITIADDTQEQHRAGAPTSTKERNRTANRILAAVDEVVAAGVLEFAKDAEKRAAFDALVIGRGKKKGE